MDKNFFEHLEKEHHLQHGVMVLVENGVVIEDHVKLGHHVTLKAGTIIKDEAVIADNCITTGACVIGRRVAIRTGAIISKGTIIEDEAFIGPGVVTNHTKHVGYGRPQVEDIQLITVIGAGAVIGSQCSLVAGVQICPLAQIGAGSVVTKDITEPGIYVGSPARKIADLKPEQEMLIPKNAGEMYLTDDILRHLKHFIPNIRM
jgi:acetyltransferase-like isoleucine patch superfamily enzyme